MSTLHKSRGKSLGVFFALFGALLGFLVHDGLASPRAMKDADCAAMAPAVDAFLIRTEKFRAAEPEKWSRVRAEYETLAKELGEMARTLKSDVMPKHLEALKASAEAVDGAIFGRVPSDRNRQRVADARDRFRTSLTSIIEVCR